MRWVHGARVVVDRTHAPPRRGRARGRAAVFGLALPCADLGDEWHRAFGERCYDTVYPDGAVEPTPAAETRGWPASQPELAELVGSPSVRGARLSGCGSNAGGRSAAPTASASNAGIRDRRIGRAGRGEFV